MLALLDAGAGLTLLTRSGKLRGRLSAAEARNIPLRRRQYARTQEPAFCLDAGRAFVLGKLHNCRTMAMRILRKLKDESPSKAEELSLQLKRLNGEYEKAFDVQSLEALRGLEGSGARAYFAILRAGLHWKGERPFEGRNRRPPRDPVNALLSLGYSLLTDAMTSALELAGLDPFAGFFHSEAYGRPALALDLVEEFRPLIVDSLVLTLVNKRMLDEHDFEEGEQDGIFLKKRGLKVFFKGFNRRLATPIYHPYARKALSYQKCFELQARLLRKMIEGSQDHYQALTTR